MSEQREWVKLIFENWKIVIVILPLLGYSGFNLKEDYQKYKSTESQVTVNIEAQKESESDITPLIRQIAQEHIKSSIESHVQAEH